MVWYLRSDGRFFSSRLSLNDTLANGLTEDSSSNENNLLFESSCREAATICGGQLRGFFCVCSRF